MSEPASSPAAIGPRTIGFCITELDPGGAERALTELVTRLDLREFTPVVYCLGPRPASNPTSLADRIEAAGIPVHFLSARRLTDFARVSRRLVRLLEAQRPALLQTMLFHANLLGARAARRANVPRVVTGIRVAERGARWHLRLARWSDRWVDRHVCVSESVRDFSAHEVRLPADKLLVIPNGVDVARFSAAAPCTPGELGVPLGRRWITFIGRLEKQKGLEPLLRLFPGIFAALPEHNLLVVGDGHERAALGRLSEQLGIAAQVHFLGRQHEVARILAASDLVVVPSLWEGMSNVVLETMAAGRPLVATSVEGIREQLGLLTDAQVVPLDFQGFAQRVIGILRDPGLARVLGRQNQLRVAEVFSLPAMVEAYQRLYRELLSQSDQ